MKINTKGRFWKISRWAIAMFAILFVLRLMYGYADTNTSGEGGFMNENNFSQIENLRKNYASEKFSKVNANVAPNIPNVQAASTQKFEKTANLNAKSSSFENDEKILRGKVKSYNAVIQYENSNGRKGDRKLDLIIGIQPEKFDTFYLDLQSIGVIKSLSISKTDKTNEYRELNAKKLSLEKTLTSLNELKQRGGNISDYVGLHDKILEIEGKMQELGVQLGNFDEENEFCTVRFSLIEGQGAREISLFHRLKVAFEWTVKFYLMLTGGAAFALLCVFLLLLILDKMGIFKTLLDKMKE
jgi:Domain of unknown function (DUF4349)